LGMTPIWLEIVPKTLSFRLKRSEKRNPLTSCHSDDQREEESLKDE